MKKRNRDKEREKIPKKRNGSAVVSVFYCRRICRIDRHSRGNVGARKIENGRGESDTHLPPIDKIGGCLENNSQANNCREGAVNFRDEQRLLQARGKKVLEGHNLENTKRRIPESYFMDFE